MTTKCNLRGVSALLIVLLFAASTPAQNTDWQAVQNLKAGTRISVKAQERYSCTFVHATEDILVCNVPRPFRRPLPVSVPRPEVREVRLKPNRAKHGLIGAGIGAGAGAGAAASSGKSAGVGALGGALGGSVAGLIVGGLFDRGRLVYKR